MIILTNGAHLFRGQKVAVGPEFTLQETSDGLPLLRLTGAPGTLDDGDGAAVFLLTRQQVVVTTPACTPGEDVTFAIPLPLGATGAAVEAVASDASGRCRVYSTAALRDDPSEAARPFLTDPDLTGGVGADWQLDLRLGDERRLRCEPVPRLVNRDAPPQARLYARWTSHMTRVCAARLTLTLLPVER